MSALGSIHFYRHATNDITDWLVPMARKGEVNTNAPAQTKKAGLEN